MDVGVTLKLIVNTLAISLMPPTTSAYLLEFTQARENGVTL